jgi:hypothetical protein
MRLLWANLRRLRRRPATWVTFLLLVALLLLVLLAVVAGAKTAREPEAMLGARMFVTFPGAYELILSMVLGIGGLLSVTYGAAIAGSEWQWGTLKAAVARGESRSRYTLAGLAGVTIYTWLGLLLAFLVGVAGAAAGALFVGVSLDGMGDTEVLGSLPEVFARAGLSTAMHAAFGFAIATVARSQLAGIGVGIGLYFAEGIAGIFLSDVVKWFPFAASDAVLSGGGTVNAGGIMLTSLDADLALVVTGAWLLAFVLLAALWTERAEISG